MLILIKSKTTQEQLEKSAEDLEGYIKFVVDIENKIMTIGGLRHVEGEQFLLKNGSLQKNLWGGGYDTETGEVDFDSMINIRPAENNPSREVLDQNIRQKMNSMVSKFLISK
jgi:hypothetical protein